MNLDQLFDMAKNFTERIDAAGIEGQPCAYEVVVTGDDGGIFSAEIKNNRITLAKQGRPDAVCSLSASSETVALLFAGKLKPMQAFMSGRVRVRGDMGALMRLAGLFRQGGR